MVSMRSVRGRELALTGGSGSSFPGGKNADPILKGFPDAAGPCVRQPISDVTEATKLGRGNGSRVEWCDQCGAFHVARRKTT